MRLDAMMTVKHRHYSLPTKAPLLLPSWALPNRRLSAKLHDCVNCSIPTNLDFENRYSVMNDLSFENWVYLLIGSLGIGIAKSGLSGVSMVHVIVFAWVFGARSSTGVLLPLLIVGDICAVYLVGKDVLWNYVRKLLPPALIGVVLGWWLLSWLDESTFKPLIGGIILVLTSGQLFRMWRPDLMEHVPHSLWFAWFMGIMTGITTMLANAAGPIIALFLLAISLPKMQLVATSAWFFLILNVSKVPFSINLGLIDPSSLSINIVLAPVVVVGLFFGRWIIKKIPQKLFDSLLLAFTAVAALRLLSTAFMAPA
jgi:uncharacterized protein